MERSVPISKGLLLVNSGSSLLTQVINAGILIWVVQHLLKRIPPGEYELLPIVMSLMMVGQFMAYLFTSGIGRYVTDALARGQAERIGEIASTMTATCGAAGAALMGLGLLAGWQIDRVMDLEAGTVAQAQWMVIVGFGSLAVRIPFAPFSAGIFARQWFVAQNIVTLLGAVLRAVLLLLLILLAGPMVLWVIVSGAAANILVELTQALLGRRAVPALRFRFRAVRWPVARELGLFGLWSSAGMLANRIREGADPIVLNHLSTPVDVNAFHVGSLIDRQLQLVMTIVFRPIDPVMTAMHATGQHERLGKAYVRGTRLLMWVILSVATPLLVFRDELLGLYLGDEFATYRDASVVLALLIVGLVFFASIALLFRLSRAQARVRRVMGLMLMIQIVNVAVTLVLVGGLGLGSIGSALATAGTIGVAAPTVLWPIGCRLAGVRYGYFLRHGFLRGLGPLLVGGLAAEGLRRLAEPETLLPVLGCMAAGWLLCLISMAPWASVADRRDLGRVVQRLRGRR